MKKYFNYLFLKQCIFLVSFFLLSGTGWSGTYDGDWAGTTNQGYEVSFTVSDDVVTTFKIKYTIYGSYCTATITAPISGNWPIIGNSFTIEGRFFDFDCDDNFEDYLFTGTFSDASSCSGTWDAEECYCEGEGSGTWTAGKPKPEISISPSSFSFGEKSLQVVDSFDSPGPGPYGLAFDGTYLWNADASFNSDKIYKLDTSGNIIDSFDSPYYSPEGLAFDGAYLWNADSYSDKIYKLEQTGGVNVGASESQTFTVSSKGDANLLIGTLSITGPDAPEFGIENDSCSGQTIPSSGTCTFDVVFSPTSAGEKSANLSIMSNDPDTPTLTLPLNGTVVFPKQKAMPWIPLLLLED